MSKPAADTKTPAAPPAYFLSLTVENFRCFKQSVKLDLSDGNGKPAMWNVLLGANGVGKTTLLQSLIAFELLKNPVAKAFNGFDFWEVSFRPLAMSFSEAVYQCLYAVQKPVKILSTVYFDGVSKKEDGHKLLKGG